MIFGRSVNLTGMALVALSAVYLVLAVTWW